MKSIMLALILAGGIYAADEISDRAAIEKTISGLNVSSLRTSLLTDDFEDWADLARLRTQSTTDELVISKEPMGEAVWIPAGMSGSRIRPTKIRFVTPEVAIADAIGNGLAVLILRKEGAVWRIASLRLLRNSGVDF